MSRPALNPDFFDILQAMHDTDVEYLVVGAYAMAVHGVPRATGDIDLWINPTTENAQRVASALHAFGAPWEAHGLTVDDLARPGMIYQLGLPPRRIDWRISWTAPAKSISRSRPRLWRH